MELTKQVCSLEISKKLKELGFEKESCCAWCYEVDENQYKTGEKIVETKDDMEYFGCEFIYNSYTASELMEYLPAYIDGYFLETTKSEDNKYFCVYMFDQSTIGEIKGQDTLSDALGLMLIYLLENNLFPDEPTNN